MTLPVVRVDALMGNRNEDSFQHEAKRLGEACARWGFVRLQGLPADLDLDRMLDDVRYFFSLDENSKHRLATRHFRADNLNRYRGFFPAKPGEHALKEGFELGWSDFEPTDSQDFLQESNVWPDIQPYEGWQSSVSLYFDQMLEVGQVLLDGLETYFGLMPGRLTRHFNNSLSTLRMAYYPAIDGRTNTGKLERDGDQVFTTPTHTDSGILTLLLQDNTGGLQVRNRQGEWMDVEPEPDTLIMNIGALLEQWSGHQLVATEHRVRAPERPRYSVPFFLEPAPDAEVAPLTDKADFTPFLYEQYLKRKLSQFVEYQGLVDA